MITVRDASSLRFSCARLLAGITVFCILLNGLVPRFSIQARDYNVLSRIMESQSILLQMFSFSSIPVKIVGELMGEAATAAPQKTPRHPQSQNSENTSTDFSLLSSDTARTGRSSELVQFVSAHTLHLAACNTGYFVVKKTFLSSAPPVAVGLFLLLFFFLLPRSGLDDHVVIFLSKHCFARFAYANRVFYFYITNSDGSAL